MIVVLVDCVMSEHQDAIGHTVWGDGVPRVLVGLATNHGLSFCLDIHNFLCVKETLTPTSGALRAFCEHLHSNSERIEYENSGGGV